MNILRELNRCRLCLGRQEVVVKVLIDCWDDAFNVFCHVVR